MEFASVARAMWTLASAAAYMIADEKLAAQCGEVAMLLERLRAEGAWDAVTLGASGVMYAGGRVPALRVPVRDSTGARDVFHGSFALAPAEGRDAHDALVLGAAAAARRCQTGGGRSGVRSRHCWRGGSSRRTVPKTPRRRGGTHEGHRVRARPTAAPT